MVTIRNDAHFLFNILGRKNLLNFHDKDVIVRALFETEIGKMMQNFFIFNP